jgi:hypothetical protein
MRSWLFANPTKRKTRRGMRKFVVGWLDRKQNEARSSPAARSTAPPNGNRKLSSSKQIPVGAKWVAALGIIYGPPSVQRQQAAE